MQRSIFEFLPKPDTAARGGDVAFVDLFCGIGGASEGARQAGLKVALAVDSCPKALKAHRKNHQEAMHMCLELPPRAPLPLPTSGRWHLHGSPSCQKLSHANQGVSDDDRRDALGVVRWFIHFALQSKAETWTMEEVAQPAVVELVREFMAPGAPNRSRVDFEIVKADHFGVPQRRKRLIAGSPRLIAALRRHRRVKRSVRDVVPNPGGTHVRINCFKSNTIAAGPDGIKRRVPLTYDHDDLCKSVDGPAPTLTTIGLRWATPGSGRPSKRMSERDTLLIQGFPGDYKLLGNKTADYRGIGNAVPPPVITAALSPLVA